LALLLADRKTTVMVLYRDADNPLALDGAFYDFVSADCVAKSMNETGDWQDATISDILK
jgi:hypothetical protein